jgi:hypothetical protein
MTLLAVRWGSLRRGEVGDTAESANSTALVLPPEFRVAL